MTGKQARVLAGMALALLATVAILAWPGEDDPGRAMSLAGKALVAPALSIAAGVAFIANRRFFDPRLIDGGGETPAVSLANRYLGNTVEQAVLAATTWLAFAAAAPARAAALMPALAVTFLVARTAFAVGYVVAPWARAFGFALTFYPSIGVLLLTAVAIIG